MGAVEVHLLGYYTLVFVSCNSVQVDVKSTSFFETEDVVQEELFFTLLWGRYWPCRLCWNTTKHHISSSFKRFF